MMVDSGSERVSDSQARGSMFSRMGHKMEPYKPSLWTVVEKSEWNRGMF